MKKLILILVAIAISYSSYAQTDSTNKMNQKKTNNKSNGNLNNDPNTHDGINRDKNSIGNTDNGNMTRTPNKNTTTNTGKVYTDGVIMKDGRIMIIKNGNMTMMTSDQTMQNGTIILSTGKMKHKDGTTLMMKEGEQIDFAGNNVSMNSTNSKYDNNQSNRIIKKNPNDKNMYLVPDSTLKNER